MVGKAAEIPYQPLQLYLELANFLEQFSFLGLALLLLVTIFDSR